MVDWVFNFDGMLNEFSVFLVCLLYILLNGVIGIVVGMVMDIFFYNVRELVNVCVMLLDNSKVEFSDVLEYVNGFDYFIEVEIIMLKFDI